MIPVPEYLDILNEVYEDNARRIADLCTERQLVLTQFDVDFAACTSIEQVLQLSTLMSERTTVIDNEIAVLFQGSKKLSAQIEVWS